MNCYEIFDLIGKTILVIITAFYVWYTRGLEKTAKGNLQNQIDEMKKENQEIVLKSVKIEGCSHPFTTTKEYEKYQNLIDGTFIAHPYKDAKIINKIILNKSLGFVMIHKNEQPIEMYPVSDIKHAEMEQ